MIASVEDIRRDFPILHRKIKDNTLLYFDNAATTQKPLCVLNAMESFYQNLNANVHRGTHTLTEEATNTYELARKNVQQFIHAKYPHECVFVRGTTEGINLVAYGFTHGLLKPNDEILITQMEHHSNIVPWQIACQQTGAILKIVSCNDKGELLLDDFKKKLNHRTKIVAMTHVSNVLGTINPIKDCIALAHANGTPVLIDAAQSVAHLPIDVVLLDCDFLVFSGHKMYGPTGIGVLYGKEAWLDKLPPFQTGGDMIQSVSFDKTTYNVLPHKFEAGTPAICEAIGLGSAIDYLQSMSFSIIDQYESILLHKLNTVFSLLPDTHVVGQAHDKIPIISFSIDGIHPHDLATYLDHYGIAVRAGQLCAEPLLSRFEKRSLLRASLAIYNTLDEIAYFEQHLNDAIRFFRR